MQHMKQILVMMAFLMMSSSLVLGAEKHAEAEESEGFDPMEMIMHHVSDSHEWHVISYTNSEGEEKGITIPLPIIVYYEGKVSCFLSSAFEDGNKLRQLGDVYLKLYHGKIYITDHSGAINHDESHSVTNAKPLDLSVTRNVVSMFLSVIILLWLFISIAKKYGSTPKAPKGIQSMLEPIILFVRDDIALNQIGKEKADRFVPYLMTVFFFVWINNLIGLVPFFPGGSNLTGNISVTMLLALFTFLITNISGSKSYWGHIFWMPGVPVPFKIMLSVVEFIGIFTKPFALMIRLMANITAGHIIILSLFSLIFVMKTIAIAPVSIIMSLMMFMLELLVAALQAYIFTLLSALFIGMAVHEEEEH